MQSANVQAQQYHNLQGLQALRSQAAQAPQAALGEVVTQFESLFMQMMLKSMREATIEGGLFQSHQMETYRTMFDQQVALDLSRQGGLGMRDVLLRQLGGEPEQAQAGNVAQLADYRRSAHPTVPAAPEPVEGWQPGSPAEFVADVWDHAVNAAQKLGVEPLVLVAQSALETGWGKRVIKAVDGASSYNLFGIKASGDWSGKSARVSTLEYRDGIAAREQASFRVYDNLAESFEDYAKFLSSNGRYSQALAKAADGPEFVRELQSAGYATDPKYADKILGIVDQLRSAGTPH